MKTGDVIPLAKPQADVESAQIKKMTIEEAAAAAARAVAEAEIAIAEAEEAAREAEAAEAEAEDAQAFAEAARSALLNRNRARLVILFLMFLCSLPSLFLCLDFWVDFLI